jgi:hypothetical protein
LRAFAALRFFGLVALEAVKGFAFDRDAVSPQKVPYLLAL